MGHLDPDGFDQEPDHDPYSIVLIPPLFHLRSEKFSSNLPDGSGATWLGVCRHIPAFLNEVQ